MGLSSVWRTSDHAGDALAIEQVVAPDAELFRREFPPADNSNHDPDQRRDRTGDGPGRGVAHLATTKHSESLERPDQTEQCEDQPDRECDDESPSHTGILPAIWSASFENVDR
jgi:hypothetical protein